MNYYLTVANSYIFYFCGVLLFSLIALQAVLYIRLNYQEGLKIGLTKSQMSKALRSAAVNSIVPSLSIVVAFLAMVPVLGIPIPWIRLSFLGSAPYELMAAGIGAKAMGVNGLGGNGYTAEVFANSVWTMCLGSIWAIFMVSCFLGIIKKRYAKVGREDPRWRNTFVNAAFVGVFSIFIADPVSSGGLPLATLISGAVLMTGFAILIARFRTSWLKEFALTFSMLGAMLMSILLAKYFA
ncbi:MAG: DUF5058 family protein [Eubacteriales bacterium]|jgi:hypothetical protein|nr:DUF5058 family protein [Eubacteriales bacterium]